MFSLCDLVSFGFFFQSLSGSEQEILTRQMTKARGWQMAAAQIYTQVGAFADGETSELAEAARVNQGVKLAGRLVETAAHSGSE